MTSRVSAYGFLGRYSGDVQRGSYRMPSSPAAPLQNFRLYGLVAWPDPFSADDLLLSFKVQKREGQWAERLTSPQPLRRYLTHTFYDTALACAPLELRARSGRFINFVGETPYGWTVLTNSPETAAELQSTPAGPVAVRWSGGLRGLLLLGMSS